MKTTSLCLITTLVILLHACNPKPQENQATIQELTVSKMEMAAPLEAAMDYENSRMKADDYMPDEPSIAKPTISKQAKKIIKDGSMTIESAQIIDSKKNMDQLIQQVGGYYESEDLQNNDKVISYNLKIRVPSANFEKLIAQIETGNDEIKSKTIEARDVTEEYMDTKTRLANKRDYLKRYKEILTRASTVKDILAIEENIRVIQEEIESKEGRLRYLSDQVNFSTLNLHLYTEKAFVYKPQPQDSFGERVKKSLGSGWTAMVDCVLWMIAIWPYLLFLLLVVYVIRWIRKRRNSTV